MFYILVNSKGERFREEFVTMMIATTALGRLVAGGYTDWHVQTVDKQELDKYPIHNPYLKGTHK